MPPPRRFLLRPAELTTDGLLRPRSDRPRRPRPRYRDPADRREPFPLGLLFGALLRQHASGNTSQTGRSSRPAYGQGPLRSRRGRHRSESHRTPVSHDRGTQPPRRHSCYRPRTPRRSRRLPLHERSAQGRDLGHQSPAGQRLAAVRRVRGHRRDRSRPRPHATRPHRGRRLRQHRPNAPATSDHVRPRGFWHVRAWSPAPIWIGCAMDTGSSCRGWY